MSRLLLLVIVCLFLYTNLYSQITYNIAKPMSYGNTQLNTLENLPTLDFDVKPNGSVFNNELDINVKTLADTEKLHGKNISRLKFKIKALSLGEMSLYFKDVKLKNGAYCFVYTNDYKIVAGPIYEKSINSNLNIMKLPTSELILEVVYNNEPDFDLKLDGISFQSLVDLTEKKKKKEHEILGDYDYCYECGEYGHIAHADNDMNCVWYGHGHNDEIFNLQKLSGISEHDYDAARSACLILKPRCETSTNYAGVTGTLMNFPYEDCRDPNSQCKESFVMTVHHLVVDIVNAYDSEDYEFLDNTLIRFNWHHEYGTPWHLENVNCTSNPSNEALWRSTINFDEVIDYCGVEIFAYTDPYDFAILKMKQKPFYKEHHLGWSTQTHYDMDDYSAFEHVINHEDMKIVGRRYPKPAMLIDNYRVNINGYSQTIHHLFYEYRYSFIDTVQGDVVPPDMSGYSGSQLTYYDYINPEQRIGIGIFYIATSGTFSLPQLKARSYFTFFVDTNLIFTDYCNLNYSNIFEYLDDNFEDEIIERNFSNIYIEYPSGDTSVYQNSHIWYPSVNNKQKCPSTIGWNPNTQSYDSDCDFDINTYISYFFDETLCITIDTIPTNLFPDDKLPRGYRIYHNFGEQRTIAYETFADDEAIEFPIEVCLDRCYMLYLMSIAKENLDIAIDFYDATGKIYNNPGCEDLSFNIDFPPFCEMFDIDVRKIDSTGSCCTYEVTIEMNGCGNYNPALPKLLDSLYFQSFVDTNPEPITNMHDIDIDYIDGLITFTYQVCEPPADESSVFRILFASGELVCESDEVDFTACFCDCPSEEEMASWIQLTAVPNGSPCGDKQCRIEGTINIPSIYSCYTHYRVRGFPGVKYPIPPDGEMLQYSIPALCIERGEVKADTIQLYRSLTDTVPCKIPKTVFCPIEEFIVPCVADCDTVPFTRAIQPLLFELPGCPQCSVKAEYVHRRNTCYNPPLQELQILSFVTFSTDIDTMACQICNFTAEEIHTETVLQAIFQNGMGFDPEVGNEFGICDETWRVSQASCWAERFISFPPRHAYYIPCDSVECCSVGLKVCRFTNPHKITIDTLGSVVGADSCILYTQEVVIMNEGGDGSPDGMWWTLIKDTLDCFDRCTVLYGLINDGYLGKRAFDFDIETKEYYGLDEIYIKMKFHNDFVDFYIDSEIENHNLNIAVHSVYGNKLLSNTYGISRGENLYQIKTNRLVSGVYIITLQINGLLLKTEKFIIIR